MILEQGEKVHIIERRYFADDPRRHLIGKVAGCTEQSVRVKGVDTPQRGLVVTDGATFSLEITEFSAMR